MMAGRRRLLSAKPSVLPPLDETPQLKGELRTKRNKMQGPHVDSEGRVFLKGMTLPQLEDWVEHTLGEKRFRARQLWSWMYKSTRLASTFEEMTDLAKTFRARLQEVARADTLTMERVHESSDGTKKILYRLESGGTIETVLIPAEGRTTICVSSQSGCALNCQFCYTGKGGFKGHLTSGEIVDQIVQTMRMFAPNASHIVGMGEGEPFHNFENVLSAVQIMLDKDGLNYSHNKVTISTSGLIPEIQRFARESKANIAVSLHACNDELRSWLMYVLGARCLRADNSR